MNTHSLARASQTAIAALCLSFGAACWLAPEHIAELSARVEFAVTPLVSIAIAALGAHAMASGLFIVFARLKSWTFSGLGASLLLIVAADIWLYAKAGAFNELILAHAAAVLGIVLMCAQTFITLRRAERIAEQLA